MTYMRNVIKIDEEKCDGCGQCVNACVEGAIQLVDGKARLVSEVYCDGLGACIGECPQGALTVEKRPAKEFNPAAVKDHLTKLAKDQKPADKVEKKAPDSHTPIDAPKWQCPGAAARMFNPPAFRNSAASGEVSDTNLRSR